MSLNAMFIFYLISKFNFIIKVFKQNKSTYLYALQPNNSVYLSLPSWSPAVQVGFQFR